ncbi:MAG: D-alanyl-D-alanine carboxypeptidase [Actinobacteria bacterium]|nr:MAG: D-alanyl-D-alanine carboxypeptidase [Actinomycetota bacterium]
MRHLVRLAVILVMILGGSATALAAPLTYPVQVADPWPVPETPTPTAASWVLYDATAGAVIDARSPDEERSMASVTKIMTGLLVLEHADLSDVVTISENAAATGEKEIDLVAGETVSVEVLFEALMIHSANDAATALAEHIAGSVEGFVAMMNERAAELGLVNTSFANPHGLDAPGHYTTANDLLTMTKVAMMHPVFEETVGTRAMAFPPAPDGSARLSESTNLMLNDYPGMIGVKTGFTNQALLTFVAAAERDGRRIYVVLLGSDGRRAHFADAELLLDHAFESMPYFEMLSSGNPYVTRLPRVDPTPLVVARDAEAFVHLAGQGLMLDRPSPIGGGEETPDPPPVVETVIQPSSGPESIWESLLYWFGGAGS